MDWEGPASTHESSTVEVPEIPIPSGISQQVLENYPLAHSEEYGIDLYMNMINIVENQGSS